MHTFICICIITWTNPRDCQASNVSCTYHMSPNACIHLLYVTCSITYVMRPEFMSQGS